MVKRYKETARGEWALEAVTLTDRAWQIGAAVNEGADPCSWHRTLRAAIDRVTVRPTCSGSPKLYLQHYTVALVLPRRPS